MPGTFAGWQNEVELGANKVLQDDSGIGCTRIVFLPLERLVQEVLDNGAQGAARVKFEDKWFGAEEFPYPLHPPLLDFGQVDRLLAVQGVQEIDIFPHVAKAAATGSPTFPGQQDVNTVVPQDGLNPSLAESGNLTRP